MNYIQQRPFFRGHPFLQMGHGVSATAQYPAGFKQVGNQFRVGVEILAQRITDGLTQVDHHLLHGLQPFHTLLIGRIIVGQEGSFLFFKQSVQYCFARVCHFGVLYAVSL